MSKLLGRLPTEVRSMIFDFGQLSLGNLASISLTCRTWQIAVFPHLYHTMRLSSSTHIELLAKRLSAKHVPNSLSVPAHLRCLKLGGYIREADMHRFEYIVPRLVHLDCLYWELPFLPEDFDCFSASSQLKSVRLFVDVDNFSDEDSWTEQLPQLLVFTNLTHFSLKSTTMALDAEDLEPITSLLRSSPKLESIILNIQDTDESTNTYSPTSILEPLGDQFVLPHLHTFHMLGDADPDWSKFASEPTHPLRAFLTRHPSIRDLAIGCDLDAECGFQMDPDDLFSTLASVKHLGCPSFVFEAVATSKLTAQLESLAITNLALYIGDPLRPTAKALAEDSLPNLRKLEIWADMCDSELEAETIEGFMLAAKGLEELAFQPGVPDYDEFLSALGGAGNLRRIRLNEQQVLELGYSGADWETLMVELAETCPRLEFIAKYEGKDVWKVIRGADLDEPSVVKVDIRSL